MENNNSSEQNCHDKKGANNNGFAGVVYVLTIIGAAIYFIQHTATFWSGVVGFLKALIWPVFVIGKVLELLKI